MAAAKYVFGIFVMMSCFTKGFGLVCYMCKTPIGSNDTCDRAVGMDAKVCNLMYMWPEHTASVDKIHITNIPSEQEFKVESNIACMKAIYTSPNIEGGKRMLERGCAFKKYGEIDGCNYKKKVAENAVYRPESNQDTIKLFGIYKTMTTVSCVLCSTDHCNATNRLTPTFFIYPPLFLAVSIICKQFF